MSKMWYVLDGGIGDILEVYEEHIVIKHKGVLNMLAMGIKGDKTIDITEITSIQFKEAGWTLGYLQFSISGGKENTGGVFGASQDENTISLKAIGDVKERNLKAKEIKEYLEKRKRELKNNNW